MWVGSRKSKLLWLRPACVCLSDLLSLFWRVLSCQVEEYERGHGAGPQGTREVNFCTPARKCGPFWRRQALFSRPLFGGQPSRGARVCRGSIRFNPVVSLLAAGVLWGFVLYAVLDDEAVTVFGEWQSWVTSTFTWLYIVSQALPIPAPCVSAPEPDARKHGSQDYWLFYLFPLCYYYGDMKLGQAM